MWETPTIVLITGVMAAGKSTVAELLARRLPRSVHLRVERIRHRPLLVVALAPRPEVVAAREDADGGRDPGPGVG